MMVSPWKSFVHLLAIFSFLQACTSGRIIDKSRERHFEMRDVKVPLVKWETTDYLRQQYAINAKLTEKQIRALAKEIDKRGWPIADVAVDFAAVSNNNENLNDRVIPVAAPGDRVVVVGEWFIDPLGDFLLAKLPTGDFLVPKNEKAPRLGESLPMTAQMLADPALAKGWRGNSPKKPLRDDISLCLISAKNWCWSSEEERLQKLKLYTQLHPNSQRYSSVVLSRQITVGLPEEMLQLSWGKPLHIREKAVPLRQMKIYQYPKNYFIYLVDGRIHSWEKK